MDVLSTLPIEPQTADQLQQYLRERVKTASCSVRPEDEIAPGSRCFIFREVPPAGLTEEQNAVYVNNLVHCLAMYAELSQLAASAWVRLQYGVELMERDPEGLGNVFKAFSSWFITHLKPEGVLYTTIPDQGVVIELRILAFPIDDTLKQLKTTITLVIKRTDCVPGDRTKVLAYQNTLDVTEL